MGDTEARRRQKDLPRICADECGFGRKGFIYAEGKALSFIRSYGTAEARAHAKFQKLDYRNFSSASLVSLKFSSITQ